MNNILVKLNLGLINKSTTKLQIYVTTHPGIPELSMLLANVTSCDQTSYCHLRNPSTPHNTLPVWTPTLMFTSTPVAFLTNLKEQKQKQKFNQRIQIRVRIATYM